MNACDLRLAAVVLAAGAGSRYSTVPGGKLLATLDGRPLLAHVLEAVRGYGPAVTVVVLGEGADEIEAGIDWVDETRARNPDPQRGLSSSIQTGIQVLEQRPDSFDGAFLVLGDQPMLRTDVMAALCDAAVRARPADRPIVAPRYAADTGPRNPVLLLRPAWPLVDELDGDRGLGPLLDRRPDMVQDIDVAGMMPDVDRPTDLEALRQRLP